MWKDLGHFFLYFMCLSVSLSCTGHIAINTPKLSFLLWEHSAARSEHGDCKCWDVRRCWGCYSADHKVTGLFWAGFKLTRWMPDLASLLEQGELLVGLGMAEVCCASCIHFCIDSILHPQCGYSSCSAVAQQHGFVWPENSHCLPLDKTWKIQLLLFS